LNNGAYSGLGTWGVLLFVLSVAKIFKNIKNNGAYDPEYFISLLVDLEI
jgi:hypothetical protein